MNKEFLERTINALEDVEKLYQETHASKSLEELGFAGETYYGLKGAIYEKELGMNIDIELEFDKDGVSFTKIKYGEDMQHFFTKAEIQAILNKINELEGNNG